MRVFNLRPCYLRLILGPRPSMHTHDRDREKSSGQARLLNIWTIWASVQPQVKLNLLRINSLKFLPLGSRACMYCTVLNETHAPAIDGFHKRSFSLHNRKCSPPPPSCIRTQSFPRKKRTNSVRTTYSSTIKVKVVLNWLQKCPPPASLLSIQISNIFPKSCQAALCTVTCT